jgi:predicted ATPase
MRRGDDASPIKQVEQQYAEMREAMDWFLDQGRLDEADRFASALVPFWMTTKRIDNGDDWFRRAR